MKVVIMGVDEKVLMEEETPVRFPTVGDTVIIDEIAYEIVKRAWSYSKNELEAGLVCIAVFEGKIE